MEKIVEQGLLYDFYGELLTEHQKSVYEAYVYNDFSLSELAGEYGISRQGVHDLIKRCDKILLQYEEKLQLVKKFITTKERIREIEKLSGDTIEENIAGRMKQIYELATGLIEEL